MVRPLKGRKRRMVRTFSYDGEYDEFFNNLSVVLFSDHKTLSDFMVEGALELSKARYKDLKAPELLKALQQKAAGPSAADQHKAKALISKLEHLQERKWPKARDQISKLNTLIQQALELLEKVKIPELSAAINRAQQFCDAINI